MELASILPTSHWVRSTLPGLITVSWQKYCTFHCMVRVLRPQSSRHLLTSHGACGVQVRARWLRERDSQRRLEQQLLTLKAAADEIVQSWAVQFYGAKGSTMFRRDSRESGVKRTGF